MKIVQANPEHFESIIEIYNWAIEKTTSTFDTEPKTIKNYSYFLSSFKKHPLLVLISDKEIIGWGCLKPYSQRSAYDDTVELSLYIHPDHHGKGGGDLIMQSLIKSAKVHNFHSILSRITAESTASIKLHQKYKFFTVGTMKEVGFKFNRRIDVILMQALVKDL